MIKRSTRFYMFLAIAAALITMSTKFVGFLLTGSVGLFSDAAESIVNLVAALVGLWAVTLAARPADEDHTYGHTKAEFLSSGVEGTLIIIAALVIAYEAIPRLLHPQPLEQVGLGLAFSIFGAAVNGGLAWFMLRDGKKMNSAALQADAQHLLTDVWTTVGVLIAVALVALTGWLILDPLIALVVALNIVWAGAKLLRSTAMGLLDTALPNRDIARINDVLDRYRAQGLYFHALRTRSAGTRSFIEFHVLVPGDWSVARGHNKCEEIEATLREAFPGTTVLTHLEPREDPASWSDQALDRDNIETSHPD